MKRIGSLLLATLMLLFCVAGCGKAPAENGGAATEDGTVITLSDESITVDGKKAENVAEAAVYVANDIVYYESGKDFTYGEGTEEDAHTPQEAAEHTVVHITKAGKYVLQGTLSKGQVAIDLGEDAQEDETAVVTLVLDGVDINCDVAPALIFYNVYECGNKDAEAATKDVDTTKAGANVVLKKDSVNNIDGSYVARIYKPDSVELSEDGTEVADAKKLHKYDGAFYSKMSMNVSGEGTLNIKAENEGLDTELHLTVNGGTINIDSGNDGINTNEDEVSVTTINGGSVNIVANGGTGEGDGIDSNGWLVINGGKIFAQGCGISGDAGIDSDMGIHINGGEVFATGNMLDRISESEQNFAVFTFASKNNSGVFSLKNAQEEIVLEKEVKNNFTYLVVSSPNLVEGDYTLWNAETQLKGSASAGGMGGMAPGMPGGNMRPEWGEGNEQPDGASPPAIPEGGQQPQMPEGEFPQMPDGFQRPEKPQGDMRPEDSEGRFPQGSAEASEIFKIINGGNYFQSVSPKE